MSKGIAISTILYLLIGVLVVGIVVYLVYSYVMNPILPQTQCRAAATTWCGSCDIVGWTGGPKPPSDLEGCAGTYWTAPDWTDCGTDGDCCDGAETFCLECCAVE